MELLTNKVAWTLPGVLRPVETQKLDHILSDLSWFLQYRLIFKRATTFLDEKQLATWLRCSVGRVVQRLHSLLCASSCSQLFLTPFGYLICQQSHS